MKNFLIISPAYNVSHKIEKLLCCLTKYKSHCLFINDGSTDNTSLLIEKAKFPIINLPHNNGVSKSILIGLEYALKNNYEYVILIDSDGQHNPSDIDIIANELLFSDAVFTNRFTSPELVPSCKITANAFASAIYNEISNYHIPDVSCGFKAFKITPKVVDYLSTAEGYSLIYKLVNYCITNNYNVKYIPTQAIYYFNDLLSTRTEELIALLSTALQLNNVYGQRTLYSSLNDSLDKVISHQNFSATFCNIDFHAFYLKEYDSYILQAPLDTIYNFYNKGD